MAFAPLGDLFEREDALWQDADIKFWVQEYLRRETGSNAVYCQSVHDDVVHIRVGSPALYQLVHVLEADLRDDFNQTTQHTLKRIKISQ